jgi:hypothetical protein
MVRVGGQNHAGALLLARRLLDNERKPDEHAAMEPFSPEFAQYWLTGRRNVVPESAASARGEESPSKPQQDALAALVERVNAARSTV